MDDLIILDDDKNKLIETLELCRIKVEKEKLKLNSKSKIGRISDGIDFVGYKTYYNRRLIRKRSLFKIKRKLKLDANFNRIASYLAHAKRTISIAYVIEKIIDSAPAYLNFINRWIINNLGLVK